MDGAVGAVLAHAVRGDFQLPAGGRVAAQRGRNCTCLHARGRTRIIRGTRAAAQPAHGVTQFLLIQRIQPAGEAPYQSWQPLA
jgi:hypothetical protein